MASEGYWLGSCEQRATGGWLTLFGFDPEGEPSYLVIERANHQVKHWLLSDDKELQEGGRFPELGRMLQEQIASGEVIPGRRKAA